MKFLNSLSDAELQAALGEEMELNEGDSDSDEELEEGEVPQGQHMCNSSAQTGGPKDTGKKVVARRT